LRDLNEIWAQGCVDLKEIGEGMDQAMTSKIDAQ
jgi:hypothetical protein